MSYSNSMTGALQDYTHLRTLPALLSVVFVLAGLYQFGGITDVSLQWGLNYTLTAEHATIVSIAVYAVAFMSSETRSFDSYEDWEKVAIAAAPALILGHQYVGFVGDNIAKHSPTLSIVAFAVTIVGWGVAVR